MNVFYLALSFYLCLKCNSLLQIYHLSPILFFQFFGLQDLALSFYLCLKYNSLLQIYHLYFYIVIFRLGDLKVCSLLRKLKFYYQEGSFPICLLAYMGSSSLVDCLPGMDQHQFTEFIKLISGCYPFAIALSDTDE